MALALTLLAALAAAEPAVVEAPKIPTRFVIPESSYAGDSVPADHPWDKLEALILKKPTTQARLDALEVVGDRAALPAYSTSPVSYFAASHRCADLADKVLAFEDDDAAYRRYALFRLFAQCGTSARDLVPKHPLDRRWERLWLRYDGLLKRLLRDPDPAVAEYFERYRQPSPLPDWRVERRNCEAAQKKLIADYADGRKVLLEAWDLCEGVARAQRGHREAASPSSRLFGKLSPKQLALLDEADSSIPDLRVYAVWSNLFPRIIREVLSFDDEKLGEYGLAVKPLALGWPDYRPLLSPEKKPAKKAAR